MTLRRTLGGLILALVVLAAAGVGSTPASAVDNPDYTSVPPTTVVTTPTPTTPRVTTAVEVVQTRSRLAITGDDHTVEVAAATTMILVGAGLLVARRRITGAAS